MVDGCFSVGYFDSKHISVGTHLAYIVVYLLGLSVLGRELCWLRVFPGECGLFFWIVSILRLFLLML